MKKQKRAYPLGQPSSYFFAHDTTPLPETFPDRFETSTLAKFDDDFDLAHGRTHISTIPLDDIDMFHCGGDGQLSLELFHWGFACRNNLASENKTTLPIPDFGDSATSAFS